MKLTRTQLQWAGLGALSFAAAFLSGVRVGLISLMDNNQAATAFAVIIACGFMFLSAWAHLAVLRKLSRQFALAYQLCGLIMVTLVVVAVTQVVATSSDRMSTSTELIWCIVAAACGVFAGPFANISARKLLKRQGYM